MTVSSSQQLQMFFVCVLFGFISGILFDVLRSFRRIYGGGKIGTTIQDGLFSLVYIFFAILLCYLFDEGRVRYYQIMGAVFGALVYALFCSCIVMKIFCCIHKIFIRIIVIPIIKLLRLLLCPIKKLFVYLIKKLHKIKKLINVICTHKKRIKKRLKLL